ncbi:hypothetical protein OHC33_006797 [Knufia fluminis]|uniref:NmrA-like domain-containing protein n=1 Tax=Knufia fluminis TaxID=191047 RepID=A0AAN8I4Z0_9EURO|nr:hypothetical protein OHC33_006797 [Knufia fluminis]
MSHIILVTGATGAQGGGLVNALLASQHPSVTIHALVRNPASAASKALAQHPNIKLFQGDFDDIDSIKAAATSCTSAFLNVTPVFTDPTGEAQHARNLIEACAAIVTLKRVVFSSSAVMHRPSNDKLFTEYIPNHPKEWMTYYTKSKIACEQAVTGTSRDDFTDGWTIIRGSAFFTNFLAPGSKFMYPELETKQIITTALKPDYRVSMLAPEDIGVLAARLLTCTAEEWNERWKGKAIPMAKENLTTSETISRMNAALNKAGAKKQIKLIQLSEEDARQRAAQGDMVVASQIFQNEFPVTYDLDEVAACGVDVDGMMSADAYFEREISRLLETVGGL